MPGILGHNQVALAEQEIPESPKETATALSLAVQNALSDGERRLEIALPDGLAFGLFGAPPGPPC